MKDGLKYIIGKQISGVVVASNNKSPKDQLFLIFNDGTYFEIWGEHFTGAGGVDRGSAESASAYAISMGANITGTYPASATIDFHPSNSVQH